MEQLAESTTHSSGLVGQLENQVSFLPMFTGIERATSFAGVGTLKSCATAVT